MYEGIRRRRTADDAELPPASWWRRNWRHAALLGGSGLIFLGASVYMLPIVLTRVDDGDRSARLIEGNGVDLIWAPEGPGWNWKQPWGGYLSWQDVALYGLPPVGIDDKPGYGRLEDGSGIIFATQEEMAQYNLCRYLNEDGTALMETPQGRVAHAHHRRTGALAGPPRGKRRLHLAGRIQGAGWNVIPCRTRNPPCGSTDHPVIYYWTADSYNERRGYFVAYNGTVNATYKLGGNPRHSYRCVKEP